MARRREKGRQGYNSKCNDDVKRQKTSEFDPGHLALFDIIGYFLACFSLSQPRYFTHFVLLSLCLYFATDSRNSLFISISQF